MKKSFYFLRHGQTDHNLYQIYDASVDIDLNETGQAQALSAQGVLKTLSIKTVCASPRLRARQTKRLAMGDLPYQAVILDELNECSEDLWRLLIVAHGGTFWALCDILGLDRDRKINNCQLVHFFYEANAWQAIHV